MEFVEKGEVNLHPVLVVELILDFLQSLSCDCRAHTETLTELRNHNELYIRFVRVGLEEILNFVEWGEKKIIIHTYNIYVYFC